MSPQFPEKITIQLVDNQGAALKIPGIFIAMKLKSANKNPYIIMLPFTNDSGVTTLLRSEVSEQIASTNSYFPMNYKGSIDECEPIVEFNLFDNRQYKSALDKIRKSPLTKYEKKRWKSRQEVISYILSNKNDGWIANRIVDLSKSDSNLPVSLELHHKK